MTKPTISVLLPAYNAGNFLDQAIQSIVNQTYSNWELIVVNDASTDNTAHILTNHQNHPQISIHTNKTNLGIARSRNLAAKLAQGKYLALQDADDYSHPLRFENQIKYLFSHPNCGLIGTQGFNIDSSGNIIKRMIKPIHHRHIKSLAYFDSAFINGSILMKKSVFKKSGGYNTRLTYKTGLEDYELNSRLVNLTNTHNLNKFLYYHRHNPSSTIQRNFCYYAQEVSHLRKRLQAQRQRNGVNPQPIISVIIPNHNYAQYLDQCLKSVVTQTYRPLDVIIVDDASTDNSLAIIKKYTKKYWFIRLVRHPVNRGLSTTRNSGIKRAYGQYLAFLDSDDWWHKDKLKLQFQKFSNPRVALTYSHTQVFDERTKKIIRQDTAQLKGNVFSRLCSGNHIKGSGSNVMVRRDILYQTGLFKPYLKAAEDWDLWLRISARHQVDYVDQSLVTIRQHTQSLQQKPWTMFLNKLVVLLLIPFYAIKFKVNFSLSLVSNYIQAWTKLAQSLDKAWYWLILILFLAIRATYLNNELTIEEPHIVKAAIAIMDSGFPKIYMGEQTGFLVNLWKPPGLVFLLAASFRLFGISEISARLVPLIFSTGQLLLIFYLSQKLFAGKNGRRIGLLAGTLFAVHPYSVQTAIQVDIDGGVLAFFTTLLMTVGYLISAHKLTIKSGLLWLLVVQLSFMTKFEPTLIVLFLLWLYCLIDKKRRQSLFWLIPIAIASVEIFFVWFGFYNRYFDSPQTTTMPIDIILHVFGHQFIPKAIATSNLTKLLDLWNGSLVLIIRFVTWMTIPLIVLASVHLKILKDALARTEIRFLFIWGLGLTVIYLAFGYAGLFPRYFAPALPALYLLFSSLLISNLSSGSDRLKTHWVFAITSVWILILFSGQPPLFRIWKLTQKTQIIKTVLLFIFLLVGFYSLRLRTNQKSSLISLTTIVFVTLIFQTTQDILTPDSLTNDYGQWGSKQAGEYLRHHLGPDKKIVTTDPIGYYYQAPYFDVNLIFPYPDRRQSFSQQLSSVSAIALPEAVLQGYLRDQTNPLAQLSKQATQEHQFGTIKVLLLNERFSP